MELNILCREPLEACVMRICDIIAYLGKDRQDAVRLHLLPDDRGFNGDTIGSSNAEIINNMVVNIIENSYGKPYLSMDEAYFQQLKLAKTENYEYIYHNEKIEKVIRENLNPMFEEMYYQLLKDARDKNENSGSTATTLHMWQKTTGSAEPFRRNNTWRQNRTSLWWIISQA